VDLSVQVTQETFSKMTGVLHAILVSILINKSTLALSVHQGIFV